MKTTLTFLMFAVLAFLILTVLTACGGGDSNEVYTPSPAASMPGLTPVDCNARPEVCK